MERKIEAEWLDTLPACDERAQGSRRDLRRINRLMRHLPIMERLILSQLKPNAECHLVDLGAGDGWFTLSLAQRIARRCALKKVTLVDRTPAVDSKVLLGFDRIDCVAEVLGVGLGSKDASHQVPCASVVTANLFLHHFTTDQLANVLELAAERAHLFVACEPRRSWFSLLSTRLLRFVGCNAVTRHDAVVSVRAGFADGELSCLWPRRTDWRLAEGRAGLFSHYFTAQLEAGRR